MPNPVNVVPRVVVPTFHLGGTSRQGNIASGVVYASHTTPTPHSFCWMRLAVFDRFPAVPSLCGTRIQNGELVEKVVNERTFPSPQVMGGEKEEEDEKKKEKEKKDPIHALPPQQLQQQLHPTRHPHFSGIEKPKCVGEDDSCNGDGSSRGDGHPQTSSRPMPNPTTNTEEKWGGRKENSEATKSALCSSSIPFGAGKRVCPLITLKMELFDEESPRTCANFRRLCKGEGISREGLHYCYQDIRPSYKGTYFHKIIPSYGVQGGDITMRVTHNGYNYHSSAGRGWFEDECKMRRHHEEGLLAMANNGSDSNGTQFFITTSAGQEQAFNGRHVCFGRVVEGYPLFYQEVAPYGNVKGYPFRYVVVVGCGEGEVPPSWTIEEEEEACRLALASRTSLEGEGSGKAHDEEEDDTGNAAYDDDISHRIRSGKWRVRRERPCLGYGIPGF